MLAAKLEEMDKDEDVEEAMHSKKEEDMMEEATVNEKKNEIEEEFDLNEILAELEEGEDKEEMDEAEDMGVVEDEMETGEMEDEEVDLEDMTEDDLKSFIEDVIADMVATGELEAGEEFEAEMGGEEMEAEEEMDDMEELDEMDEVSWNEKNNPTRGTTLDKLAPTKVGQSTSDYAINEKLSESNVSEALDPQAIEMLAAILGPIVLTGGAFAIDKAMSALKGGKAGEAGKKLAAHLEAGGAAAGSAVKSGQTKGTMESAKSELEEIEELKKELHEVNLLNAKLLYTNKIFNSKTLNESQKLRVLKAFDKASSVKEAKVIFETLNEGMTSKTVKSSMANEIKSSASKATGFISESKQPIVEVDPMVARWQKLAGIK